MPLEPPPWILNSQADIDACAEGMHLQGYVTTVWRNINEADGSSKRYVEIRHLQSRDPVVAEVGQVVLLLFGKPQVVTLEEYQNSPFYEGQ